MKKRRRRRKSPDKIILLAYLHRYVFPLVMFIVPAFLLGLLGMGLGLISIGLLEMIGYHCRWKHVYCAWQDAKHEPMTPGDIRWHRISKWERYGDPAILIVLGLIAVIFQFIGD